MRHLLLVAIGGAIGAGGRHLVNSAALRLLGSGFPYGTVTVNIVGSLVMGLFVGWLALRAGGGGQDLRLFFATGVLGGFTTFSSFSLDFAVLWERGDAGTALLYLLTSVFISIAALFVGLTVARAFA